MPFCPFYCMVPLRKLNNRKKGALITKGSLRNLVRFLFGFIRVPYYIGPRRDPNLENYPYPGA